MEPNYTKEYFEKINVFVFCSGKSGSSTLYETFNNNGFNAIHIHGNIEYQINLHNEKCLIHYPTIYDLIKNNMKHHQNIYIIDSYRVPIERKISGYFESYFTPDKNILDIENELDKSIRYLEEYHSINEILEHFNLPHFNGFDFTKKYNVLNHENIKFIKIRFKDINNWDKILSEIFNKNIEIYNSNLSSNKLYSKIIKNIYDNYKIPSYMIENIENCEEFKIYNTLEEQQCYLNYWGSKVKNIYTDKD